MGPGRVLSLLFAGLFAVATSEPALAAPKAATPPATATARLGRPVTLVAIQDLDFATLTVGAAGTATINANTEAMTTTGGVQRIVGTPSAAHFQIAASRLAIVLINAPSGTITLTRVGGTETMTVSNWTMDSGVLRIVPANGVLDIAVAGRLNVGANQKDGVYTGQFTIDVDYF